MALTHIDPTRSASVLHWNIRVRRGTALLTFAGPLDESTVIMLHKSIESLDDDVIEIDLDLLRVPTIDAHGIAALIHAHDASTELGVPLRVAIASAAVRSALDRAGVSMLLHLTA